MSAAADPYVTVGTGQVLDSSASQNRTEALLGHPEIAEEDAALAEKKLRKLANQHGHRNETAWRPEYCPDPYAHIYDVGELAMALEACGLLPYKHARGRNRIPATPALQWRPG